MMVTALISQCVKLLLINLSIYLAQFLAETGSRTIQIVVIIDLRSILLIILLIVWIVQGLQFEVKLHLLVRIGM